ncbi:MAG: FG-GAP repeat protein, partial [Myxococcales bacterium]|nr:FG-GAP repeat protein [Myxococcales bacterium]
MRRALIPFGAPALAYALGATLSLGCFSGCFSGGFLAGVPCESDVECGPSLACFEGVCGGHDAQVPDLPPPPSDLPDPGSDSDSETDTEPGPDALELRDDDYETLMEATLTVLPGDEDAPLANDGAPPGEPYAMIPAELETSAGGAASVTGAGGLSYAPAPFFWGCDAFTYSAQDDRGAAGSAMVRVTVRPTAAALTGAAAQGHGAELVGDPEVTGAGASVAFAGDVNGDGLDDLVIGALVRDAIPARVRVYVVFGREDWALPTLAELAADGGESASGGFLIIGEPTFLSGSDPHPPAVASAGDVNGDGLDDLLIGLDNAKGDVLGSGRAYVVFGKPDAAPVLLEEVGGPVGVGGFALNAHKNDERAGADVAALGDLNADGFDDLVIGAPDTDELYATGRVYVVFGKPTTGLVSLEDTPGSGRGFWIDGPLADAEDIGVDQGDFGAAVANAGD